MTYEPAVFIDWVCKKQDCKPITVKDTDHLLYNNTISTGPLGKLELNLKLEEAR